MFLRMNRAFKKSRSEDGFTLLELLVVIVLIGILAAIAVPVFINAQNAAHDASVKSDARNTVIGVASALVTKPDAAGFSVLAAGDTVAVATVKLAGIPSVVVTVPTGAIAVRAVVTQSNWVTVRGTGADYVVHAQSTIDGFWYEFSSKTGKYTSSTDNPPATPKIPSSKVPVPNSVQNPTGVAVRVDGAPVTSTTGTSGTGGSGGASGPGGTSSDLTADGAPHTTAARMVSTWNTSLTYQYGNKPCTSVTLPISGPMNATINWGDGTITNATPFATHSFTGATGILSVEIDGTFSAWGTPYSSNGTAWPSCFTGIPIWGETGTKSLSHAFQDAINFQSIREVPSTVTDMSNMFAGATLYNSPVSFFTGNVTNMSGMFEYATAFNQPLSLDTGKVTDMNYMLMSATAFNQPLTFNTVNVKNMSYLFYNAQSYNQPLSLATKNVTDMSFMFTGAAIFNSPVALNDTTNLTNASFMFSYTPLFNQPITFDTSNVTDMSYMFSDTGAFNQPVNLNTDNVTNMGGMFSNTKVFNSSITFTSTNKVTEMGSMFLAAEAFNQPLNFDTSNVTSMNGMFDMTKVFNQPLNFDTSNVTSMNNMFFRSYAFNQVLTFNTSNVTDMSYMFAESAVFNTPLSFNISSLTQAQGMFTSSRAFNQNIRNWDMSNIQDGTSALSFADNSALAWINNPYNK